jgi:hypothetical protein
MRLAGVVKYDARNLHWKIDNTKLKIYRFLPYTSPPPAKTTHPTPITKPIEEKTTPLTSETLAKEILEHVVEKHGMGKPTKPFRYVGGDWQIKDELLDLLAKSKCKTLVEVFGGSGIVSMYAPEKYSKT